MKFMCIIETYNLALKFIKTKVPYDFTSKLGPNIRDYHLDDYELQLQINRIVRPLRLS
jgi:hypothetical protein